MAIYHLNVKNISRGDGRSIVAAAAYRAGETLPNDAEERLSEFGGRRDVVANEIRLPSDAAPWMADRAQLWNAVEAAEIRKDARLAKEVEFALPRELPRTAWLAVARIMADAYTAQGFVVDLAIHDDGTQHNPHVHLLMTTRVVTPEGFGPKIRSADGRQFVTEARALWARTANGALKAAGVSVTIDSRSHAKRRLDQTPDHHRGPDPDERRARRAHARKEREPMRHEEPENDLPVPDPDGAPIHPRELDAAETRMLDAMHREAPVDRAGPDADLDHARAVVDAQNSREMTEDEALAYRLAPEDLLDWLDQPALPDDPADLQTLERWEDHLDWLDLDSQEPVAPADEGIWQEPERSHR
ncbi:MobA/MobL family protein [Rhizobium sp. BR 314]|uniref:MobA/MobL family protein n=1 Tax=Rhizobium sp. BR 314 TaxID=3040013 RepID=UPI0039BF5A8E